MDATLLDSLRKAISTTMENTANWHPTEAERVPARKTAVWVFGPNNEIRTVDFVTEYVTAWFSYIVQFMDIDGKRITFLCNNICYIESEPFHAVNDVIDEGDALDAV